MSKATHGGSKANLLGRDPKPDLVNLFSNEKQVTDKTPPVFLAAFPFQSLTRFISLGIDFERVQRHFIS